MGILALIYTFDTDNIERHLEGISVSRKRACRFAALEYEVFEPRQLLASIVFESGSVFVRGNATDDHIELVGNSNRQSFTVVVNDDPKLTETFQYADVKQLTVFAGDGNDRVTNTLRRDTLIYGGPGNDYLEGGFRNDTLLGGDGIDKLVGRNGEDVLHGHRGGDWIYGGPGEDQLFGHDGADRIFGGAGDDTVNGGAGDDELRGQDGADKLFGAEGLDRIFGESGDDELVGESGNDLLIGGTGNDRMEGNSGNDLINGNEGHDTINAGPGNDIVNGGTGDDVITGLTGVNTIGGNGGNDRIFGGNDVDRIQGGSGDDVIVGNQGDDVLVGGPGNDRLEGNAGNDWLGGSEHDDTIYAGPGDDLINGGTGDDLITGFDGANVLNGNGGNDQIYGGKAIDEIHGGSGDDLLAGGEGHDVIVGNAGADRIFGGPGNDSLNGSEGNDFLFGQQGNDQLDASAGNDRIHGNMGSDTVRYFSGVLDFRVNAIGERFGVTDIRSSNKVNGHGFDALTEIESLAFGEASVQTEMSIADAANRPYFFPDEAISRINNVLPDGWKSRVIVSGKDLWARTIDPSGVAQVEFRLGAAGVIGEIRDVRSGKTLLAPTFRGEVTDRVVQWTMWELGRTVRFDVGSLPDFEDRFNMTQAGTFDGRLHGIVDVDYDAKSGQIDIWSVIDRNWRSEQDAHMEGTITALTQVKLLDGGAVLIRRVVRIGDIRLQGKLVSLEKPYLESWTPFSDSTFDSMAVGIDSRGQPNKWYADGRDIPHYPQTPVQSTRGWAMAYDRDNIQSGRNMSLVFGTDKGTVFNANGSETTNHRYHLNSMDFDGGMAFLPAIFPGALTSGAIIEQHLVLMPGKGITSSTAPQLDALAKQIPAPRIFHAGAATDGEISAVANRLSSLANEPRVATDRIATLL